MKFVPPYRLILESIGMDVEAADAATSVTIPMSLFRKLLSIAAADSAVDAFAYLRAYPDVANSTQSGTFRSARDHFAVAGYFEGRSRGTSGFDVKFYQQTYKDVPRDPDAAEHHYFHTGAFEWRQPSPAARDDLISWRKALCS